MNYQNYDSPGKWFVHYEYMFTKDWNYFNHVFGVLDVKIIPFLDKKNFPLKGNFLYAPTNEPIDKLFEYLIRLTP